MPPTDTAKSAPPRPGGVGGLPKRRMPPGWWVPFGVIGGPLTAWGLFELIGLAAGLAVYGASVAIIAGLIALDQ